MAFVDSAAYELPLFMLGMFEANQDLSAITTGGVDTYQFTAVTLTASTGTGCVGEVSVAPATSASSPILGILQNSPQTAEAATVMQNGISKAKINGSVSVTNLLVPTTGGKLIAATNGQMPCAMALTNGNTGDTIPVLIGNWGSIGPTGATGATGKTGATGVTGA